MVIDLFELGMGATSIYFVGVVFFRFVTAGVYCCEVGVYVLLCNGVCVDACFVSCVIEYGLFLESGSGFMYC